MLRSGALPCPEGSHDYAKEELLATDHQEVIARVVDRAANASLAVLESKGLLPHDGWAEASLSPIFSFLRLSIFQLAIFRIGQN